MRLIDADALLEALVTEVQIHPISQQYNKEDVIRAIMDAPTIAHGTDSIMIKWTPELDKLARDVAFRWLNEFSFLGKSIQEWAEIILEQQGWQYVSGQGTRTANTGVVRKPEAGLLGSPIGWLYLNRRRRWTGMPDREKVIRGLTACIDDMCDYCPYYDEEVPDCDYYGRCNRIEMNRDALALLKEQEPVEPIKKPGIVEPYRCGACKKVLGWESEKQKFCPNCGRKVKWNV